MKTEWQLRCELAAAYQLAHKFGMTDTIWNHISVRLPDGRYLMKPLSLLYDEVTASSLLVIEKDGSCLAGDDLNATGHVIHGLMYQKRNDISCMMHTHTDAGMAVSCMKEGLLPLIQDGTFVYPEVAYHDFEGAALEHDEAPRLLNSLGSKKVLILRNHGLLTVGGDVGEAFVLMLLLEKCCKVQVSVMSSGCEPIVPDSNVFKKSYEGYIHEGYQVGRHEWPALKRLLDRDGVPYNQ